MELLVDIARLVIGYLKEDCLDAAAIFAASSPHLYEYRVQTFRNENPSTTLYNLTLDDIFQEFRAIHTYIIEKLQRCPGCNKKSLYDPKELINNFSMLILNASEINPDLKDATIACNSEVGHPKRLNVENEKNQKSRDAKLVLKFLEEECPKAAASFAAISPHLAEYRIQIFQNKIPSTTKGDITLIDIIQQYCSIIARIEMKLLRFSGRITAVCIAGNVIKYLEKILFNKKIRTSQQIKPNKTSTKDEIKSEKSKIFLSLTKKQENILNAAYQRSSYLKQFQRHSLAVETKLTEMQVKQWFQKRRNIENGKHFKKQNKSYPGESSSSRTQHMNLIFPS